MAYPNGQIPLALLQRVDDDSEHLLPPGTAARWRWMVAAAQGKYGVTLRITPGPNAYRWYDAQVDAKRDACAVGRCEDAADPGSSSHGGIYDGRECMAIDVYNWGDLADDSSTAWARFVALCRLAGFTVLLFDWERWHITDFNDPWTVPAWTTPAPAPTPSEEDDMLALKITLPNGAHYATLAPGVFSGLIQGDDPNLIRNIVRADDTWTEVNEGQLRTLLHKHGIDLTCYRPAGGDLEIRDALTGVWSRGGRWAASDAILSALGKAAARA